MRKLFALAMVLLIAVSASNPVFAANGTWDNTGITNASWVNPDNWSSGTVPGAAGTTTNTDIATFNTTTGANGYGTFSTPVIIDTNRNIGGINFDTSAGNYYIGSPSLNPLLLTSGGTIQILSTLTSNNAIETINAPLVIEGTGGTYTFTNNSANGAGLGAGTLNIGGNISGGASGAGVLNLGGSNANSNTISGIIAQGSATSMSVSESGLGTWILSGINTYNGTTTVNGGRLVAGSAQAFGVNSAVTVEASSTLDLWGFNEAIGSLSGAGIVTNSGVGSVVLTTGADNTSTTFSGNITSAVGLAKEGSGTFILSGENLYTGTTTVNAGTLEAGSTFAFGSDSQVTIAASSTLDLGGFTNSIGSLAGAGTVTNSGATAAVLKISFGTTTFSGNIIDGASSLDLYIGGMLTLTGNNTYSGTTSLGYTNGSGDQSGELSLGSATAIGTGTIDFYDGTLQFTASNTKDYSSQFDNVDANQTFNIDTNGQDVTFASPLVSTGGELTKLGTGTLTLTGANSYSGVTTISAGILQIGNGGAAGSLGTGSVTDNASLVFDLSGNSTVPNVISGTGTVTQNGSGTITLSGPNSYSGATIVNSGTLKAGIITDAFGLISTVNVAQNATLDLGGFNETVGSLSGAGTLTNSGGSAAVITTGNDNTSTVFSGNMTNGSASVGFTKVGSGTLTLSGDNTNSGVTTLNGGTINLGSGTALGSGLIIFYSGTLQYSPSNNIDYSGQFSTVASQQFNIDTNGQSVTFASPLVSNGGTLTKLGNGTLTLTAANTYSGITTISAGTLQIGNGGATGNLGTGSVTDNAGLVFDLSASPNVSNLISGTGTVAQSGSGTVTLSGANTYTGVTTVNSGKLEAGVAAQAFGIGSDVTVAQNAVLDLGGFNETVGSLAGAGTLTNSGAAAAVLTTDVDNSSTTFSGKIQDGSSTTGITMDGSGTFTLSGDNTFTGATTLNTGVLNLGSSTALGTGTIIFLGGTLQYSANNQVDYSGQFSSQPNQLFNIDTNGQNVIFASPISSSAGTLTKIGNGTLTLLGANTYTGQTTISGGTLLIGDGGAGGSLGTGNVVDNSILIFDLNTSPSISNAISGTGVVAQNGTGTVTFSGPNSYTGSTIVNSGTLKAGVATDAFGMVSAVTEAVGGTLDLGGFNETIGSLSGSGTITNSGTNGAVLTTGGNNSSTTFSGNIQDDASTGLTKNGSGTLTLTGDNTYSGPTTLNAGILNLGSKSALGSGTIIFQGGTLQYSAMNNNDYSSQFSSAAGQEFNIDTNGQDVTFASPLNSSAGTLTKIGNGTLTLSAANNYSGGTVINAGVLQATNANALGSGAVTNNASLAIGTTGLTLGGMYNQNAGSALNLTIDSGTLYGNITAPSANIAAASTINVHIQSLVANNTQFEIINTGGSGVGSDPLTINSDDPLFTFTSAILNGNLFLTETNDLYSLADNPNARAIVDDLEVMTNPSSDMLNVLNTLVHLSNAQITAALNTMGPELDRGVIENSNSVLNNFIGASVDRIHQVLSREDIINGSLDRMENSINHAAAAPPASGLSSGDGEDINGLWAKPYGSYLNQDSRQYIQGFQAWNAGTVVGLDRLLSETFMVGVSGGYGYGMINAQGNNGNTGISSAQGTVYAGYQDANQNFFINTAGSLAWNWYGASRDINIGALKRTADAQYNGQQYNTYIESGYRFKNDGACNDESIFGDNVDITPLISLEWTRLTINSYTETNAGSLDLNVNKQNYNLLESGLGASFSTQEKFNWGIFVPEIHAKWLYDYIQDNMTITSSFTGGGGEFTTSGIPPDKNGVNFGSKLTFKLKDDVSLAAEWNIDMKEGFFGVYGSGTVNYKF